MTGENNIVGFRRDRSKTGETPSPSVDTHTEAHILAPDEIQDFVFGEYEEEGTAPRKWRRPLALGLCLTAASAWVGLVGYTQYIASGGSLPGLAETPGLVALASAPLALIGVVWIALLRNSTREANRYASTIADLDAAGDRLETLLHTASKRITLSRQMLSDQADSFASLGESAVLRLNSVGESMRGEVDMINRHTSALKNSAAAARADMAVLLSDLPKAQVETRQLVASLQDAGLKANTQAVTLEAQVAALTAKGREAQDIAGGAAERLAAHLSRMEGVSETAGARLEEAAGQMTSAVDSALERAAQALETARQGMEAQGAAMRAMVEQGQAALQTAGADSSDALSQRVEMIVERVERMSQALAAQDEASRSMMERLTGEISEIEARLVQFGANGTEKADALSNSIEKLRDASDDLQSSLETGGKSASLLIERAETLITALDASSRELDETLPAAYDRLAEKADAATARAKAVAPEIAEIERAAAATLDRLMEAEGILATQRTALEALVANAGTSLNDNRAAVQALTQSIDEAESRAKSLAEGAGPLLVEALVQVKETATLAAERSRQAFADIIPQTAETLSAKSKEALEAAITKQVEDKLVEVAQNAENAVQAAQKATERLMRQMLTIAETSTALEARIAEAKEDVDKADASNFSRRIALLIESLNSTAIDVTKILSNDVTDTAWASYLKGDRGVFTRRAVRLLETGEAREIQRHYEQDQDFRDHVNRYIHDFEAMLRQVLSTREGQPMSVTLLSSDPGKLYVALAQAIERLRV